MLRRVGPSVDQIMRSGFLIGILQITIIKEEVQTEPSLWALAYLFSE